MDSYKTTPQQFELFVKTCKFWQKQFGLFDYRVQYYHEKMKNTTDCATATTCKEDRTAAICLNTAWVIPVTFAELQRVALHEVMHVLLADLTDVACQRCISETDVKVANEGAVVRLENGISDLYYNLKPEKVTIQ